MSEVCSLIFLITSFILADVIMDVSMWMSDPLFEFCLLLFLPFSCSNEFV